MENYFLPIWNTSIILCFVEVFFPSISQKFPNNCTLLMFLLLFKISLFCTKSKPILAKIGPRNNKKNFSLMNYSFFGTFSSYFFVNVFHFWTLFLSSMCEIILLQMFLKLIYIWLWPYRSKLQAKSGLLTESCIHGK